LGELFGAAFDDCLLGHDTSLSSTLNVITSTTVEQGQGRRQATSRATMEQWRTNELPSATLCVRVEVPA
jgi:hypothetical protein